MNVNDATRCEGFFAKNKCTTIGIAIVTAPIWIPVSITTSISLFAIGIILAPIVLIKTGADRLCSKVTKDIARPSSVAQVATSALPPNSGHEVDVIVTSYEDNAARPSSVAQVATSVLPPNSGHEVDVIVTSYENNAARPSSVAQVATSALPPNSGHEVDVIVVAGPGGDAFDHQIVDNLVTPFNQIENKTVKSSILVGNGEQAISIDAIIKAVKIAKKNYRPITLFIHAHGDMRGGEHQICMEDTIWISSRELFQQLRSVLGDKYPLSVFMTSCHGGGAVAAANAELPKGSIFVALSSEQETVCGSDVKHFATANNLSSWSSSEELLYDYLINSLQNRIAPVIVHVSRKTLDLRRLFQDQCGKKFSNADIIQAHELLDNRMTKQTVNDIIDKIQHAPSEWSILALEYGRALAVTLAAQKIL